MASEKQKKPRKNPEGVMTLGEHLRELRNRLIVSVVAIAALSVVGWIFFQQIFDFINEPFLIYNEQAGGRAELNFQGVTTGFEFKLRIAVMAGFFLATPVWLYEIWAFVMPGLKKSEKRYAVGFLGAALPLFVLGCWVATLFIPHAVPLLLEFTPNQAANLIPVMDYFTFIMKLLLAFGIAFVIPVFIVGLNFMGLVKGRWLVKSWRWATFIAFLFAAIANPAPDPWSMIALALAVLLLYWIAVAICFWRDRWSARRKAQKIAEEEEAASTASEVAPAAPLTPDQD
ncbi:twin-arginine translocase subunit TatC [Micrococcales bacterium 31B]|nr:twin-arginine translocase subunit TatC [Micrococcales bacterium 31B]